MAIREGKWKCPNCSTINRGRDMDCKGCGATREPDVKFFLDDDAPEVTDESLLDIARGGADWICPYCGTTNRNAVTKCGQCSAARDDAKSREEKFIPIGATMPTKAAPRVPLRRLETPKSSWLRYVGLATLLLITWLIFASVRTHDETLTVSSVHWIRAIDVERFTTLTQESWEDDVPSDARRLSSHREIHHYNKVQIGTRSVTKTVYDRVQSGTQRVKVGVRDKGNGFFEDIYENRPVYKEVARQVTDYVPIYRDDPVYREKVRYNVDRWVVHHTERAEGSDVNPRFPTVELGEKEREGGRVESYAVTLTNARGKTFKINPRNETEFRRYPPGSQHTAKLSGLGKLKEIKPAG
jgi:hypothetical protein